jgi:hypothetical protein
MTKKELEMSSNFSECGNKIVEMSTFQVNLSCSLYKSIINNFLPTFLCGKIINDIRKVYIFLRMSLSMLIKDIGS